MNENENLKLGIFIPIALAFVGLVVVVGGVVYYGNKSIEEFELQELEKAAASALVPAASVTPLTVPVTTASSTEPLTGIEAGVEAEAPDEAEPESQNLATSSDEVL